ncbi:MAG TPA: TolC family protein, partial [Geobacteraceae bacterium]
MLKITISIALFFMALGTASAETVTLSLKEVITRATGANNLVRAAGYRADAARQRIAIAESGYYPGIAFEESFTASNAPTQAFMMKLDEGRFSQNDFQIANLNSPGTNHDFRTAVTLYQPIYNPSTAPAREMAVKESEKQGYSFDSARQDTAFTAFRLYLELQKAKAQARAAEQAVAEAQENLRLAKVRSDNGTGLRSDELRARTHLALAEQRVITERNRLTLAGLQLASVLAMNVGEPIP